MSREYTRQDYIDDIKLDLTADVLELEIDDETIGRYLDKALNEIQRYIDESTFITVPYSSCIDITDWDHSSIVNIYRAQGYTGDTTTGQTTSQVDPMYAQTWAVFSSGGTQMYNLQNYLYNYLSYSSLLQIRNTLSTPLDWKEDKHNNKLYITNSYDDNSTKITIEYIPYFNKVEDVKSPYWRDILRRVTEALVKIGLGRTRTRFTQSNAVWSQDGDKILSEGLEELKELRETLRLNSTYFYTLD